MKSVLYKGEIKMSKNKTKGGYVHGIYVSAKTRKEFKENKQQYLEEGIRSSYTLQKQKNITTKMLKIERESRRESIRKAYNLEKDKLQNMGYNVDYFLKAFQKIEEYNQKINLAVKQGKILSDTPLLSFPISIETGKINLNRLKKEIKKTKTPVKKIQQKQYNVFYHNVEEVYGKEIAEITKDALNGVTVEEIYNHFNDDINLSVIVEYDIDDFDDDAQKTYWEPLATHVSHFLDMVEDLRRGH